MQRAGKYATSRMDLILNPVAHGNRSARRKDEISAYLKSRGLEAKWHITESHGHAYEIARGLPEDSLTVAVGGDGTVHEVAAACSGTSRTMAVLPTGSGNDYVKALGIGANLRRALHTLTGGEARLLDTGLVNTDEQENVPFNNGLGVGFDAQVAAGVDSAPQIVGGVGGYLWSVGRLLIGFKCYSASIRLDGGEELHSETILLAAALGTTYGSTFRFAPDARLDDGLFDVVYSSEVSLKEVLGLLPHVLRGTHIGKPKIHFARAAEVEVRFSEPLTAHVDGELLQPSRRFEARAVPGSLRVLAPRRR